MTQTRATHACALTTWLWRPLRVNNFKNRNQLNSNIRELINRIVSDHNW